jgi:hypothetical protein
MAALRRRLGGIGTPTYEVLSEAPNPDYGIPRSWVDQFQADYYNGRARDIHGNRIGTEYEDGDFKGVPIDPDDPPMFESEAVYLQRHGLLTAAEERHLEKHPELLDPETL